LSAEENEDAKASDAAVQVRNYVIALDDFIPRSRNEKNGIFNIVLARELHGIDPSGLVNLTGERRPAR
jgi:hypothetical protein